MRLILPSALLLCLALLPTSCFTDKDDDVATATSTDVNDFIWRGLNTFYLYKEDVDDLSNNRFTSDQQYTNFLRNFSQPRDFFDALLSKRSVNIGDKTFNVDDFSFLVSDFIALEQAFDGVTKSNGMEYSLVREIEDSDKVIGYVRYVLPGTDAATKGIKRGVIFNTVNGVRLTTDPSTFAPLRSLDNYTIGLATYDGETVSSTGESVQLTKSQNTENPVHIAKTLDIDGNRIGYLMYNGFTANFDPQLNEAFGKFKSDGVTDLVLDLRYNGGGSVMTAIDLSSMITGQFNGQVFSTEEWNSDLQERFGDTNLFDDKIRDNSAINSLNLSRVFILTSGSSASASELVINGLDPYIEVIKIGTATRGKFQASITLYDSNNFGRTNANTGHSYAMQPLVLRSANADGVTDYFAGFAPDIELAEKVSDLGVLGDPAEPLLKTAIEQITGVITKSARTTSTPLEVIGDSKMHLPTYERMYIDQ